MDNKQKQISYFCPNCSGLVEKGVAIKPVLEYGCRPYPNMPLINAKTMSLIEVYKCKKCGFSCDDLNNFT